MPVSDRQRASVQSIAAAAIASTGACAQSNTANSGLNPSVTVSIEAPVAAEIGTAQLNASLDGLDPSTPTMMSASGGRSAWTW